MNLHELVSRLIIDTKGAPTGLGVTPDSSIGAFYPELIVCLTIVVMLAIRVFKWGRNVDLFWIALVGSAFALLTALPNSTGDLMDPTRVSRMEIFTGMLVYDTFTAFMRVILLFFAVLFIILTKLSGIPDREDGPDVYALMLGSTLGMCLMASSNHLLMVFLAVEMASVPSYVLAGLLKGRREGSEAALKYSIYGAGAAGVMLYGISLVCGITGAAHLPTVALRLAEMWPELGNGEMMALGLGGMMVGVGLSFKLSAVPFHFWCPDVFEGATAEVNAFLSVASKAAALALLIRVSLGLGSVPVGPADGLEPGARTAARNAPQVVADASDQSLQKTGMFAVKDESKKGDKKPAEAGDKKAASKEAEAEDDHGGKAADKDAEGHHADGDGEGHDDDHAHGDGDHGYAAEVEKAKTANATLAPVRDFAAMLIAFLALVTCTFGNLAAYGQTNIKRLLAYSTIAHAGYMMMAVPPALALVSIDAGLAEQAIAGLAVYLFVYLFMNLGAFAIVAFLRNEMGTEEISRYGGIIRYCPGIVICFSAILFSLVGLPPLAGFIGKFAVFAAIANGYQATGSTYLMVLLVAGGVNTAISLFYYLRVVKVMVMGEESDEQGSFSLSTVSLPGIYVVLVTIPTLLLIVGWDWVNTWAQSAASYLIVG